MQGSLLRSIVRIDWRRRDVRDAVVIFGIALIAYLYSELTDLPAQLLRFANEHQDWDLDDLLLVSFVLSIALIVYAFRRIQDLSREIKARQAAEREAQTLA